MATLDAAVASTCWPSGNACKAAATNLPWGGQQGVNKREEMQEWIKMYSSTATFEAAVTSTCWPLGSACEAAATNLQCVGGDNGVNDYRKRGTH